MRCGRTAVSSVLVAGVTVCTPPVMNARQTPSPSPAVAASTQAPRSTRLAAQGFSVMLIIADLQAASGGDDVPPAARQALSDMKDFLPYKSYKLLDAAWIMGTGRTISRLRGPEDRDYEVEIASGPISKEKTVAGAGLSPVTADDGRISVQFSLRETGPLEDMAQTSLRLEKSGKGTEDAEEAALRAQMSEVQTALTNARARLNSSHPEVKKLEKQLAEIKDQLAKGDPHDKFERSNRRFSGNRAIMNTSFTMESGETVVVGTSRLKGNSKALIALLTAVPPRGARTGR